jgi:L-seryl-tRNA(Ser) seleniumtransferase
MKVGKEEIIGLLAAVEEWSRTDLSALNDQWERRVRRIAKLVETVAGVTTDVQIPTEGNSYPTLTVHWDEKLFGLTVSDCDRQLRAGEPRIEVLTSNNPSFVSVVHEGGPKQKEAGNRTNQLQIVSMTLQEGEDLIVGQRLRDILRDARRNVRRS